MQYSITTLPKSQLDIEVILPFEEFEPHLKRAAAAISEEKEIQGFRRGKAPYEVVRNVVGEEAIYERGADIAVRKTYPKLFAQMQEKGELSTEYPPIGSPQVIITKLAPKNELRFKIKLWLIPKASLPDYKRIAQDVLKKEKREIQVDKEEISKALEWIKESRIKLISVDRPAKEGDRVEVSFEIRQEGVKIESGDSKNHPLVIGSKKFVPGFEDQLIGMKPGEEKEFYLTIPEKWHHQQLAGKKLQFKVKMELVQERQLPDLDDEFAKSLGKFSSLEELKKSIKEGLMEEKKEKEKQRIRSIIISKIADKASVEIPDILVESELDNMLADLAASAKEMGLEWEEYLLHLKKTTEQLRDEWRKDAQKRVRIALTMREIAKQENIQPSEEEIQEYANRFLRRYGSVKEAEKDIDPEKLLEYTQGILRNEKVFEFLEKIAKDLS